MNTTPNLGLKKPLQTEFYNVDDFNYNSDIIDQAIHDLSENKQNKLSTSQMDAVNSGITSAKVAKLDALPTSTQLDDSLSSKANKSDITNISITGTTNNTGATILAGTLFYLNGSLCETLVDVADGATFTEGTNYNTWTMRKMYMRLPTNYYLMDNDFGFSVAKASQILSDLMSFVGMKQGMGFIWVINGMAYGGQYYIEDQSNYYVLLNSYADDVPQYKLTRTGNRVYVKTLLYS